MKRLFKPILLFINWVVIVALILSYLAPFVSPRIAWPIAFFGLTHVLWYGLGILFLISTISFKRKIFRYNLIVVAVGLPFLLRVVSFNSPEPKLEGLKIVGFNTYALGAAMNTNTTNEIQNYLDTAEVDVAVLPEWRFFKGKISRRKFPYQVRVQRARNLGNGILMVSKHPITASGIVPFSEETYNMAGYMDLNVEGQKLRVYGVHLETTRLKPRHYHELKRLGFDSDYTENAKNIALRLKMSMQKRTSQVEDIQRHMANCDLPCVIVDDFNDGPQSYTYQQLRKGKSDAFVEAGRGFESTFLRPVSLLRIDFILFDEALECTEYRSTKEIYSDHKLIFARLNFKSKS